MSRPDDFLMRCARATVAPAALVLGVAASAWGQGTGRSRDRAVLRGHVRDSSAAAVASAVVSVYGAPGSATTNARGEFSLSGLPGGTRVVQVIALGYKPRLLAIALSDETDPVTITLARADVVLDSMHVVAEAPPEDMVKRRNERITERELEYPDVAGGTAMEAFARLRPQLFRGRPLGGLGPAVNPAHRGQLYIRDSITNANGGGVRTVCVDNTACAIDSRLSVSINEGPLGSPDVLTILPARTIREMRYLRSAEASARFGVVAGGGPVLIVYTK